MQEVFERAAEYIIKRHLARKCALSMLDNYIVGLNTPSKIAISGGGQGNVSEEERLLEARTRDPDYMRLSKQIRVVDEAINALRPKERDIMTSMMSQERGTTAARKLNMSESAYWKLRKAALSRVSERIFEDWKEVEA
jgi:DNA-directed RNA polymerase specialized sigma subunit